MNEGNLFTELTAVSSAVLEQSAGLVSSEQIRDGLRAIQQAQDALDGAKAKYIRELETTCAYEDDGSSSVTGWARNQLRMTYAEARKLLRCAHTLDRFGWLDEKLSAGKIRMSHVEAFDYGRRTVEAAKLDEFADWLCDVAETCDAAETKTTIRTLHDSLYDDDLDEKWKNGMDKEDLKISPVLDGWHVTGFLPTHIGAKLKTLLDALSAPAPEDDRTPAQRRVDAIDELASTFLASGLPTAKGIRPQIHVTVDHDTLVNTLRDGAQNPPGLPAELTGFGAIGPELLAYLMCGSDVTGVLTNGSTTGPAPNKAVLNVGRRHRLATDSQRTAVRVAQNGICAAPGCRNSHLEIHHATWWSHGGPTDQENLVGLCSRCHHLIHRQKLNVAADGHGGFTFTNANGRIIDDPARASYSRVEHHLRTYLRAQRAQAYQHRSLDDR